ncbi:MAG: thiamine pyrophosphate-binding protein [Desulfomonile tiedjei]|nr:thiamine pyrophosphate-binding protein [Desulfomonile tiedjei]
MIATQYILRAIAAEGITHVFMVPGGLIDPFYPELGDPNAIRPIVAAHEGGAAYMADGYARASGRLGVCFAIGGPGVTNTVTAMATALSDRSAVLLISGEVPTNWEGRGGFQDASASGLNDIETLRSVTAYSMEVEDAGLLDHHLRSALASTLAPRSAPAHLSIPRNIQTADISTQYNPVFPTLYRHSYLDEEAFAGFWDLLVPGGKFEECATRVAILAGQGVEASQCSKDLQKFAEQFHIPVATTLRAKGVLPEDHPLSFGVFGYAGTRHATELLLGPVDILLVLGSGLNQRDTMYWNEAMRPTRGIVQVDVDAAAIAKNYPVDVAAVGDCGKAIQSLINAGNDLLRWLDAGKTDRQKWMETVRASGPLLYDEENCSSDKVPIHPARVITALRDVMPRDTVALVDSGAHRAFAGHYWKAYAPKHYISATNLGPMGWAIPAGIGAKLARPELPCVVITGDGCMLMHGMEIQTAARFNVPVIWVVVNNGALGNVYLRAKKQGPGPAALTSLPIHDWAGFARSLGAEGVTVEAPEALDSAFKAALEAERPFVVDVRCGKDYPTPVTPWSLAAQEWMDNHHY